MGNKPEHTSLHMLGIRACSQKIWTQRKEGKRRKELQLPELRGGSLSANPYLTHLCESLPDLLAAQSTIHGSDVSMSIEQKSG